MAVIGSLSVKLGLITVEWDQATTKAKAQAKDLQKAFDDLSGNVQTLYGHWKTLGGSLSAGALGMAELLHQTLEFSNEINDLAKGFDITIAKTLQFRDAIKTSGGNAEGASKMMSTLFGKIYDAQSGNEAAIAQFERLGISFKELATMKPEEALNRTFEALSKMTSTYDRVKSIKELLGKQGIGLAVDEVAEKLGMSTIKYEQYAKSIEKVGEVSDNLKSSFDNLKIAFADMIAPFTRDGVVSIEKFKAALYGIAATVVVSNVLSLVAAVAKLVVVLKEAQATLAAIEVMSGAGAIAALAGLATYFVTKGVLESDAEKKAVEASSAPAPSAPSSQSSADAKAEQEKRMEANRREIIAAEAKIGLLQKQIDFEKRSGQLKVDSLSIDKFTVQLGEVTLTQDRERAQAANARAQALNKENLSAAQKGEIESEYRKQVDLADTKALQARRFIVEQREKELSIIRQQIEFNKQTQKIDVARQLLDNERVYMTDYQFKIESEILATNKRRLDLEQQIVEAKQKMGEGQSYEAEKERIQGLIDAENKLSEIRLRAIEAEEYRRTNFTEGWQEAFRKFATDAQAYGKLGADMFQSFVGNMNSAIDQFVKTGKLNFKSFAQSVIQDIIAMMLKFQAMQLIVMGMRSLGFSGFGLPGIGGKAVGGNVYENTPQIVGENGPELFIPQRSGTVVPNQQMGQALQGQPSIVYNGPYIANMSAIDTQSAQQFLAKNKMSVWSANQSASRTLPTSR